MTRWVSVLLLVGMLGCAEKPTHYYINPDDPHCDDAIPGTLTQPWCTNPLTPGERKERDPE